MEPIVYETPVIVDHGSIADHTFQTSGDCNPLGLPCVHVVLS